VLPDGTKALFVGGLTPDVTQEEIKNAFSAHGTVSKVELKESFAYVYMTSGGTVAHDKMNDTRLGASQRRIRVEWARSIAHGRNEPKTPNTTLYIADYDPELTPDDLTTMFKAYGNIVRITPCKKFTFIQFEKIEDAIRAHDELQNKTIGTRTITVQYALPEPHRKATAESSTTATASTTTSSSSGTTTDPAPSSTTTATTTSSSDSTSAPASSSSSDSATKPTS